MRRSLRLFAGLLCVAVLIPAQATAREKHTERFRNVEETFTDIVPCREDLGDYEITTVSSGHFTVVAAGFDEEGNPIPPYNVNGLFRGTFTAVPLEEGQPEFSGKYRQRFSENVKKNEVASFGFMVKGTGSDGSTIKFHEIAHLTVNKNGTAVEFEKARC